MGASYENLSSGPIVKQKCGIKVKSNYLMSALRSLETGETYTTVTYNNSFEFLDKMIFVFRW